ncbi:DUF2624 family protein [Salipaludibacillus daqingensis]|uniref:DUF2624 family protein n=1 Tax=Salipaludibacillus daqingensis TaxID=3041001 RepID=UPI002472FE4C|nr:DUF2624 family protein [Salipaludibacillus daqingensis]
MNPVIRDLINEKVRQLTLKELIKLSKKENIPLTVKEARRVITIIQQDTFDISNHNQVNKIREKLKKEFPNQYQQLLPKIQSYEHYLE